MKTLVACLALLVAVPFVHAQATMPAAPGKAAPAKKADAKKANPKEEAESKIDGLTLTRPNGHFLGLTLQGGKYKLSFYDKKKRPEKVDVTRATARWPNLHGPGDNRAVLNPAGDGTYLLGTQFVRGPYSFKLYLTLLRGDGDGAQAVENYTVDFRG